MVLRSDTLLYRNSVGGLRYSKDPLLPLRFYLSGGYLEAGDGRADSRTAGGILFCAGGGEGEYPQGGQGTYLEGYDDAYVLSPGYTVGDYRKDHALADEAQKYIDQMTGASPEEQERLRKKAESAINRIYGQTLKGQILQVLEGA